MDTPTLISQSNIFLTQHFTTLEEIRTHICRLREVIISHNERYYQTADPVISDEEYDHLFALLGDRENTYPELITTESPTQKLIGQTVEGFEPARHLGVMQSLMNTYGGDDIQDRHESITRLASKTPGLGPRSYIIEPKIDGMSVELVYEKGKLVRAVTRGDGTIGEDITTHARLLQGLPLDIPALQSVDMLSLRGEIVIPREAFVRLSEAEKTTTGAGFANARNAAAGTLRQLDTSLVRARGLAVFVYDILFSSQVFAFQTARELFGLYRARGFSTLPETIFDDITTVIEYCTSPETMNTMLHQEIGLDGLVIKINELEPRGKLGTTNHHPRRAIAYKFPAQQAITQLMDVSFQVGRTGVLTPVAHLAPIELAGVIIQKATLHNRAFIQERGLRIGDQVLIQRSGEVIPYIVSVLVDRRQGTEQDIELPTICPSCEHPIFLDEEVGVLRCTHSLCPAQLQQRLEHFVSKACLDITGLGPRVIEQCIGAGLITDVTDIFSLVTPAKKTLLRSLPGIAQKKIALLETEITRAHHQPLWRVLFGLSIRHIGAVIAKDLQKAYETSAPKELGAETFIAFCLDAAGLSQIKGCGPEIISSLSQYFTDLDNVSLLKKLDILGVIERYSVNLTQTSSDSMLFAGKKIVLTGTFPLPRSDFGTILESHGAKLMSQVSAQTDLLIAGESAGSKYQDALAHNVTVLTYIAFLERYPSLKESMQPKTISRKPSSSPAQTSLF